MAGSFSRACRRQRDAQVRAVPLTRKLEELVQDLAVVDDPQERLALLVDRTRRVPALPGPERVEANRVRGCVSVVWLVCEVRNGLCQFRGDAEAPLVRGLVLVLTEFFSGFPPAALAETAVDPLETLGVARNLSPTRRNGLAAVREAIRAFARGQLAARPGPP